MLAKGCLNDSFARSNLSNWFSLISCLWDYPHASHVFLKCIHYRKLILFNHVDWIWTILCIWTFLLQKDWQIIVGRQICHVASPVFLDRVKAMLDVKAAKGGFRRCLACESRNQKNRMALALTSCMNDHWLACTGPAWIPVSSVTGRDCCLVLISVTDIPKQVFHQHRSKLSLRGTGP